MATTRGKVKHVVADSGAFIRNAPMRAKTVTRGKYRANYSQDDMEQAFNYVFENNVSAQRASSIFNVPVSTLKDRINGKINIDTLKSGPPPMFTQLEEAVLAQHLVTMGEIGYAYTRQETLNLATDYAIHLGYRDKDHPLSTYWLYSFIERFPELKIQRPRKLEATRAKYATKEAINNYFSRLTEIVRKYGFSLRPQSIFNIDEKGLSTDVTPSKVVAGKNCRPQTITSGKSKTVTMLCATSAIGFSVPPYFIFPGQRMRQDLMDGASPGADGTVSESGWSNAAVFISYMKDHLLKFLPLRDENNKVLVLYDGHKSHVSLSLIEWAKKENIILFVLPPHTSHLLQPLDIGCFGPFETAWAHACHSFLRQSGGKVICKYDICKIACHVHGTVMTASNITSSFKKSGVYPLDSSVVPDSAVAPSLSFPRVNNHVEDIEVARSFLDERGGDVLANATATKKPRNTLSRIVGGRAITEEDIVDKIREHEEKQRKGKGPSKKKNPQPPPPDGVNVGASTSGIQSKRRKQSTIASQPQHQDSEDTVSLPESDDEEAKCCVCGHFTPREIRENPYISICNWAQCDDCNHWTHLKFCTAVRFVRTKGSFKCPHCENCTEE